MITEKLQYFLIFCAVSFFYYLIMMIRKGMLELKYALLWLLTSIMLIVLALKPQFAIYLSANLGIEMPVNAIFLIGNFFTLMIMFSLTIALSRNSNRLINLTQELAILKEQVDNKE